MSGSAFVKSLARLGYPSSDQLDNNNFDWLFENEKIVPFLGWFCHNLQESNLLHPKEIQEFRSLQESSEGILDGVQLENALHNLSIQGEESSLDKIEDDINGLREEIAFAKRRKETLMQQRNKLSQHQRTLNDRLLQMDSVEGAAKKKYTQSLEQSQADNVKMNAALDDLNEAVHKLSGLYRAGGGPAGKEAQEAVFLSHVDLEPYYFAEEKFTQELTTFTKKQFFEGIADMAGAAEGSQYELLEVSNPVSLLVSGERKGVNMDDCKELGRLQLIYPKSESQRTNALVELKSTTAAYQYAEDKLKTLKAKPYPQNIKELRSSQWLGPSEPIAIVISVISIDNSAKLQDAQTSLSLMRRDMNLFGESKIPALMKDSAALQVTKVLRGDYMLKIARQDYFTSNQDRVIHELVIQRARNEFFTMAYELEIKTHRDTHRLLTAAAMLLQSNLQAMQRRMQMMEEIHQIPNKYRRGTVDSRDKFITRLHQILGPSVGSTGKQQMFLTYQELGENTNKLHTQVTSLRGSLASSNSIQDDRLSVLETNMKACQSMVYSESSTVGGLPILSPQPVLDTLAQLDNMLKKLEEAVMDIIKDIDSKKKILKTDPMKVMERELFTHFYNNPEKMRQSVDEVAARVQAHLAK